ncbi:hypothetical protein ACLOJK_029199 [Asimina triloba]
MAAVSVQRVAAIPSILYLWECKAMPRDLSKACLPLVWHVFRHFFRVSPPFPASAVPVIHVSNNISRLGNPREGKKARQLLLLPPFPSNTEPLPGRRMSCNPEKPTEAACVSAITWVKYYLADIPAPVIQQHFNKGLDLRLEKWLFDLAKLSVLETGNFRQQMIVAISVINTTNYAIVNTLSLSPTIHYPGPIALLISPIILSALKTTLSLFSLLKRDVGEPGGRKEARDGTLCR